MTQQSQSCAELDTRLPDYLDGDVAPAERRLIELHLSECVRCASLVHDLREITSGAAALPALAPSRDLWADIAERIEAPVIPLPMPAVHRTWSSPARLAAVAAALVVVTAGITYRLTVRRIATGAGSPIAMQTDSAARVALPAGATPSSRVPASDSGAASRSESLATGSAVREASRSTAPVTYDAEIRKLRDVLTERRAELDPRTAAILDNSLRVIDEAIAQSRDALAHDPASQFLMQQLNHALEKKVSLLRTAASLPSRS